MKILITGGCGLLGSNLCRTLLERGDEVTCLDNLSTSSLENISDLLENQKFKHVKHDVTQQFSIANDFDQIYHLACPASPPHYQKDPVNTLLITTVGTMNVLDFARSNNSKVLYTSTSEVYGDPLESPQKESYRGNVSCNGIRACYDEGKRVGETFCFDYMRQFDMNICVVRIFNTYGPFMSPSDGRVVSNFLMQALSDDPITIYGSGEQTRSFCYVDDTVNGLILMMNADVTGPINIGNPEEFTMNQLAHMIKNIFHTSSSIVYKDLPQDDPQKRCPDITLAKELLGWQPVIGLKEGLEKTMSYFRKKNDQNER